MKRLQRAAVLCALTNKLKEQGSWCGETHVQKATYILQEMLNARLEYQFVLYKHGPYSFDLSDELSALCADGFVALQAKTPPYGPSIVTTDAAKMMEERFPKTLDRHKRKIDFVADKLGDKGVVDLERLATAFYVTKALGDAASAEKRSERLHKLKPHVSIEQSKQAVGEMDEIIKAASGLS